MQDKIDAMFDDHKAEIERIGDMDASELTRYALIVSASARLLSKIDALNLEVKMRERHVGRDVEVTLNNAHLITPEIINDILGGVK